MIIKFNPLIFDTEDKPIQREVLKFILDFLKDGFIWDLDNISEIFGDDGEKFYSSNFAKAMVADDLCNDLSENLNLIFQHSSYLTNTHKHYLSTVTVGIGDNEIHPLNAYDLLSSPSVVVVENGDNDWNFVKGLVDNYQKQKDRKPIYALIKKAIESYKLIPENAGGSGGILKRTKAIITGAYRHIYKYKITMVFDSDRSAPTEINDKWVPLLTWLKAREFDKTDVNEFVCSNDDVLGWHMLYKREMENYVPLELLYLTVAVNEAHKTMLEGFTPLEHDFYNFDGILADPELKNLIPTIFQTKGIRQQLENRCSHHKIRVEIPSGILEEVSEPEKILLMIAKII